LDRGAAGCRRVVATPAGARRRIGAGTTDDAGHARLAQERRGGRRRGVARVAEESACIELDVDETRGRRGHIALTVEVVSPGDNRAVTAPCETMIAADGHVEYVRPGGSAGVHWPLVLVPGRPSDHRCGGRRVILACLDLDVRDAGCESRHVALAEGVASCDHRAVAAPRENVGTSGCDRDVRQSGWKSGHVVLAMKLSPMRPRAIAPPRDLCYAPPEISRR
jgi:hypothetical protein